MEIVELICKIALFTSLSSFFLAVILELPTESDSHVIPLSIVRVIRLIVFILVLLALISMIVCLICGFIFLFYALFIE